MQLKERIKGFSIEDSNIIKGIGILLIAFHNYFHWIAPHAKENEFDFSINGVKHLIEGISANPYDSVNLIFSFWGHFGVQLFIFISGYGLMRAYQNKKFTWGSFVSKRINKLWPTFFFAIVVFYSLFRVFYFHYGIELPIKQTYILKLTFLSNFFPNEVFSLNGPWWFYSMIVQLYLIFPLLLKLHKKWGNISLVIISLLAYALVYNYNPWFVNQESSLYFFFLANIPVFSLGMILASKDHFYYHHFIGLIALIGFGFSNFYLNLWYISHLLFTIISLTTIYYLFLKGKRKSVFYKVFLFYGELSMYFFAIHGFLRRPFLNLAEKSNNAFITILYALVFIAAATVVALLLKWVVNNYLSLLHKSSKYINSIQSKVFSFYIEGTKSLMQLGTFFLFLLITIRIYEYFLLHAHHDIPNIDIDLLTEAIFRDLLIGIGLLGILLIPYLLLYRIAKPLAISLYTLVILFIAFASIGLIQYYDLAQIPLDRVIYAYSWADMMKISKTTEFNSITLFPFIISIFIIAISIVFYKRVRYKKLFIFIFPIIAISLAASHNNFIPKSNDFDNDQEYYYSSNKLLYFIKDIVRYKKNDNQNLKEVWQSIRDYHKLHSEREYTNVNFPFLRKADKGDPLGPFFNKTSNNKPPNIVFIIVESLCPAVSGPNCYKTSMTPFLDSLTKQSLFWRNNLSTAERTFGVLPATLASLPYGKQGFLKLGLDMPEHKSIINILSKNKYSTRFFYGGWTGFDNIKHFMELNRVDTIINNFDAADSIPPNDNSFSWGFSDRAIFRSTFNTIPQNSTPYLSIYLTLSTHSPFSLKNASYYEQRVLDLLKEANVPEDQIPGYLQNKSKLATFVFFDDELRNFFNEYKKRDDYKNTIFVITGDHRGIIFYRINQIDVYHTPLIIFSPLLKSPKEFGGVTSHADLTPTFINYLENNYQIQAPEEVSWLGNLLDTSEDFHSAQRLAFMRNNRDIRDYLMRDYYLATDNLYKVEDNMDLEQVDKPSIKAQMKKELNDFKNLNLMTLNGLNSHISSAVEPLISSSYDFENKVPDYFKDYISTGEAASGTHSVILKKKQPYGGIMPNIELDEGISRIYIELSFKVYVQDFGKQNPLLVFSIEKNGNSLVWEANNPLNNFGTTNQWHTVKVSKTLFLKPEDSKGSTFKLYLWNQHGTQMYYDDIKVNIKVKK